MKESIQPIQQKPTNLFENMSNLLILAKKLEKVYENRPSLKSFIGCMQGKGKILEAEYSKEVIERDERYVAETRDKIEKQEKSLGEKKFNEEENKFQLSEIMQALVVDLMNRDWFKDCKTIMTSDFDDLKNGFDAVMKRGEGYLGMSIDFTVSNKENIIHDKLEKEWKRNIKDGIVPKVKYFEDPDTKQKGNLLVPKFIVGASKKDVEEFAGAYLRNNVEELNNHPFKYIILLQIEEQLQTVLDYYENDENIYSKKFEFARRKYNEIQMILRRMKREIHLEEEMRKKIEIFEYSKENVALNTMKKFRMTRE